MKRREFLAQVGGGLAFSQLPAWAITTAQQMPLTGAKGYLNLTLARKIEEGFLKAQRENKSLGQRFDIDLGPGGIDLEAYSSASVEALEYLAPLEASWADFGFENISPEMAKALSEWKAHVQTFSSLKTICPDAAIYLGSGKGGQMLCFDSPMSLDASCAKGLVCNEAPLYLTLQTIPDLNLAKILATQQDALSLTFPGSIVSPLVAEALSVHAGYRLEVSMPNRPSEALFQQFSSNPKKEFLLGSSVGQATWKIELTEDCCTWSRNKLSGA